MKALPCEPPWPDDRAFVSRRHIPPATRGPCRVGTSHFSLQMGGTQVPAPCGVSLLLPARDARALAVSLQYCRSHFFHFFY